MNESVLLKPALTKDSPGNAKKDHPGIYIPPPLIYAAIFFLSVLLQKILPLPNLISGTALVNIMGFVFIALWLCLFLSSMQKFISSKNTIVTIKPASSLQTRGIYAVTRNPMYLSLLMLYIGIAVFKGNWYTFILLPLLILIVQFYMIRREEKYLERAFGEEYRKYRSGVRRWI